MKEKKQTKQNIIIVLLCILLILTLACICLSLKALSSSRACCALKVSETQSDYVNPLEIQKEETEYTELMGFGTLELDAQAPFIYLINPPENEVYLSFDVLYENEVLYSSDLISPGKMEDFDVFSVLDAGEHTLTYSISSYDLTDRSVLWSGVQQNQDIFIRK